MVRVVHTKAQKAKEKYNKLKKKPADQKVDMKKSVQIGKYTLRNREKSTRDSGFTTRHQTSDDDE
jgi:hypothetical protein